MRTTIQFILFLSIALSCSAQSNTNFPCSHESFMQRMLIDNPKILQEQQQKEKQLQEIIKYFRDNPQERMESEFTIPVVLHVFHWGDEGKITTEQALSGLQILNDDINGLNEDWGSDFPEIDSLKGRLDINFCLASRDPDGNPTTGIIYYEDEFAINNNANLYEYAWDNYKYLNIYLPKYTQGSPSDFTGFATFPSQFQLNSNRGGIHYSSIRFGYGPHSELEEGDDWASVITHEAGHFLDLRHTFENTCNEIGDFVDDTPPTQGFGIELGDCYLNDFSCGVKANVENYMDYNHRCKTMFTKGQVERMTAALYLPSRISLWDPQNLIDTGCAEDINASTSKIKANHILMFPNPSTDHIYFKGLRADSNIRIYNTQGKCVYESMIDNLNNEIRITEFQHGMFFYVIENSRYTHSGKFVKI